MDNNNIQKPKDNHKSKTYHKELSMGIDLAILEWVDDLLSGLHNKKHTPKTS